MAASYHVYGLLTSGGNHGEERKNHGKMVRALRACMDIQVEATHDVPRKVREYFQKLTGDYLVDGRVPDSWLAFAKEGEDVYCEELDRAVKLELDTLMPDGSLRKGTDPTATWSVELDVDKLPPGVKRLLFWVHL